MSFWDSMLPFYISLVICVTVCPTIYYMYKLKLTKSIDDKGDN